MKKSPITPDDKSKSTKKVAPAGEKSTPKKPVADKKPAVETPAPDPVAEVAKSTPHKVVNPTLSKDALVDACKQIYEDGGVPNFITLYDRYKWSKTKITNAISVHFNTTPSPFFTKSSWSI